MALEIEVKFYLGTEEAAGREIRSRIEAMGGRSGGRVFERNIRFEDAEHGLLKRNSLLRLRQDRGTRLTFKSESAGVSDRDRENFKIFEELEVEVSDFSTMVRILGALGYHPAQVYEKRRETIAVGGSHLCMDTMPFGEFLEIEGERDEIPALAARIGLDWNHRILETYLGIFAQLKQALSLPFGDVTFDHFRQLPGGLTVDDLSRCIRRHEIGGGAE
ncbi:class IV adenylate cyclase [Desulfococcus sp.]|uniref:class IV adenylate cyclase n=1 Tax=Desulfococcus sp. TaxID=2025834 RepID=UPI0035934E9A